MSLLQCCDMTALVKDPDRGAIHVRGCMTARQVQYEGTNYQAISAARQAQALCGMQVAFVEPPSFSLALTLYGGDISILPGLEAYLQNFVRDSILRSVSWLYCAAVQMAVRVLPSTSGQDRMFMPAADQAKHWHSLAILTAFSQAELHALLVCHRTLTSLCVQ